MKPLELLNQSNKKQQQVAFLSKLFKFRNDLHNRHLNTKSYAEHIALNEAYDYVLDYTDELIESYQGKNGLISLKVDSSSTIEYSDSIKLINDIISLVEQSYLLFEESWIKNQIDELIKSLYQTKYKLVNLK